MTAATIQAIISVANADATASKGDVDKLKLYLTGRTGEAWRGNETMDEVVPCRAVADLLHVSTRTVQIYARRGFIKPVKLGAKGTRAMGYTKSSVLAAMHQ